MFKKTTLALGVSVTTALWSSPAIGQEASNEALKEAGSFTQAVMDNLWLVVAGALVFLMQAGFAVLSAGSIRTKNVKNILLKNLLDACMGARNLQPRCNQSIARKI